MRHYKRRHRTLDKLADRQAIERQPCRPGVSTGGLDLDVIFEQFQRQPGGLRRLVGQYNPGRAGIDHHRSGDAVDPGLQCKLTGLSACDLHGAARRRDPPAQQFRYRIAGTRDLFRVRIGDHGAGRRRQRENDEQKPAHSGPPMQV